MQVAVVDCGSSKTEQLQTILQQLGGHCPIIPLSQANEVAWASDWDGVVMSGGPYLWTQPETRSTLLPQFEFLETLTLPTLGICLSHQAIGLKNGTAIFLGAERRTLEPLKILAPHPLVAGLDKIPSFVEDHCEGIRLPTGFECIAASKYYDVEIMVATDRPLFGVQFHPEVSGESGVKLLANFMDLVQSQVVSPKVRPRVSPNSVRSAE